VYSMPFDFATFTRRSWRQIRIIHNGFRFGGIHPRGGLGDVGLGRFAPKPPVARS
jgi:hypothetical protein